MKDKILSELFNSNKLNTYAKNVCGGDDFHNDIIQELYLFLYEQSNEFIEDLHLRGKLYSYSIRIIYLSWNSPTSPFYRKYKNAGFVELRGVEQSDTSEVDYDMFDYVHWINKIESDIKESWYNGKVHTEGVLMLKYIELGSYRDVSKEMDIPHTTVQSIVQRYAKKLKDE